MCLNWSYLKNNSRRQCTDTPLDPQLCRSLNWQHREPIESSYDPSEALLKIPARGSRAPADGGFPLVRETQRERERAREQEERERTGFERSSTRGGHFPLSWLVILLADKKDGKEGKNTPDRAAKRSEKKRKRKRRSLGSFCLWRRWQRRKLPAQEVKNKQTSKQKKSLTFSYLSSRVCLFSCVYIYEEKRQTPTEQQRVIWSL